MANILEESRNLAIEVYRAAHVANSSNSTPNSNSNPSKKGKNKKKGSYNLAIEEEEEFDSSSNSNHISNSKERPVSPAGIGSITLEVLSRKAPPTYTKLVLDNVLYLPNININIVSRVRYYDSGGCLIKKTLYGGDRRYIAVLDFKKSGFFLDVKGSFKPILHANFAFPLGLSSYTTKSIEPPIIEDTIVSEAIEPNKRYKLRNSPAKSTTLEDIGPSLRGKRPCRPTREPEPLTGTRDLPCILIELVIEGNKVEKAISSPTLKEPNISQRDYYNLLNLAKLWHVRLGHIGLRLLKKTSSITKGLPNFDKIKEADFHYSSCNRGKAVRRVSKALIPDLPRVLDLIEGSTIKIRPRPYNRNPIVLLLVDRKSRYRWVFNLPNKSGPIVANAIKGFFGGLRNGFGRYPTKFHFDGGTEITDLLTTWLAKRGIKFSTFAPYIHKQNSLVERSVRVILDQRYRAIGARGEAIIPLEKRSKSLKFTSRTEEYKLLVVLGSKNYLVYILSRRAVLKTSTVKFIEDNTVLSQPTDSTALKGELVDLDLDLEGAVSPDPSNLNTEKPISIEIGPSKLEPYESSSDSELDEPLPDKPINPVIVESTRPTISIRKPELPEAVISKDSTPTTYKQVLKLPKNKRSKWLEAITKEFIQLLELGVFKFLPRSLLPSNRKLITCRNVLKVKKDAKNRPIKYKSRLVARGFIQVEGLDYTVTYASTRAFLNSALREEIYMEIPKGLLDLAASNKAIYKLLLKYGYNPSTTNIIKLSKALYSLKQSPREWSLNRPIKSHLNAAKNLFKYLNSTKDYSICFSCNENTVADLGPKLSNSSNTITKLSRDFHSKEGPRPLTTTSTTIVDSRNSKGSSRTPIINSSLVPIGFSDSDFTGDKATSKSTYGYLYKLTEAIREVQWIIGLFSELHRPIDYPITLYRDNQGSITVANNPALYARTKHTLLKFQYVREQVKAKIVTIIYLNTNLLLGF
ncbi:hypothetical protein P8C59_005593 [Phyllachora maydis]|uniref:Integrase catalytic domain-containing protein n=1 Tax=Phyllachora maydis TaxID=1825666 RepID=A0AAD9MDN4_9PEZI|nr:hypothetical protein P8C59_005593 [Phyllachora maydis]